MADGTPTGSKDRRRRTVRILVLEVLALLAGLRLATFDGGDSQLWEAIRVLAVLCMIASIVGVTIALIAIWRTPEPPG